MLQRLDADLENALRRELEADGVTCVRNVLNAVELAELWRDIETCIGDGQQLLLDYGSGRRVLNGFFLWTRNRNLQRMVCDSSLPMIAAQLMGSKKINLFCDNLFLKEPKTPNHPSPWHNDQPHWIVKGQKVITFWIALDHVDRASGSVQFVRGSHLWDFSRENFYRIDGTYEAIADIDMNRNALDMVHYELAPGDMTAHYGMTMHCAFGNHTSDRRRRGYAIRYTGDDVVYEPNASFETPVPVELIPGAVLDSFLFPVAFRAESR